ncbi:OmpA family protein [Pseudomonas sp. HR96]|uniref:OmpA family protein n=1 Tax=Pseudomonas sp. HR96 TaxID=1027966 RepID=UPI002A74A6DB|nr:OmpA family protein [Pseudomonas sp. HR96]WPO99010.1 OmpA family protein [Pseudomonas sp. HR96]
MSAYKTLALAVCLAAAGCAQTPQNQTAAAGHGWWPFGADNAAEKVADKDVEKAVNDKVVQSEAQSDQQSRWWWPFGDAAKKPAAAGVATAAVVPMPDPKVTQAWLDANEPKLREAVKGSPFTVERREDVLVVIAPIDSTFNPNRPTMLMPITLSPITNVAKVLEADPHTAVLVLGHADASGAAPANQKLSQERAQSVAAIFRLSGLQRDRLNLRGMGSLMPRAANDSVQGRSLNRRVEMVLTPQDTMVALLAKYSQPTPPASQMLAAQEVQALPPATEKATPSKKAASTRKAPAKPAVAKKKPATPAKAAAAKKATPPLAKKKTSDDSASN